MYTLGIKRFSLDQLKINIRNKLNKVVRYPCVQCKFAASTVCSLRKHIQYKHLEVKYPSVNMLQLPCQLKN